MDIAAAERQFVSVERRKRRREAHSAVLPTPASRGKCTFFLFFFALGGALTQLIMLGMKPTDCCALGAFGRTACIPTPLVESKIVAPRTDFVKQENGVSVSEPSEGRSAAAFCHYGARFLRFFSVLFWPSSPLQGSSPTSRQRTLSPSLSSAPSTPGRTTDG